MPSVGKAAFLLALATSQFRGSAAFIPSKSGLPSSVRTDPLAPLQSSSEPLKNSYGEESRKFRRTVYSHDDWVKHRSPDRFFRNLISLPYSGININLGKEIFATSAMASAVIAWNCVFGDYQDFDGVVHAGLMKDSVIPILSLPLNPFTLASPSLGLLLVFRTNTAYKRWDEARKNWGMNINHTRDLVRLGNAYYDRSAVSEERAKEDLDRLALNTWSFVRCMKRHLSPEWEDEEDFKKELLEKLPKEQAEAVFAAAHRPNRALQDLSTSIENMPMHFTRKNEVHRAATIFEDNLGSSERLLTSPIPVFYSRHTARFLSFWLLLLPFGLWGPFGNSWNHIALVPGMFFLSLFLFGIEELATQLEEPFTILPMQAFCDKIYNWCTEIVTFQPGDNGMPVYQYQNDSLETPPSAGVLEKPVVKTVVEKVVVEPEPAAIEKTPEIVEVLEEVVIEEPVVEEPVIEEPIVEEAVIEEPIVVEAVIEEPIIEEPVQVTASKDSQMEDIGPVNGDAIPTKKRYTIPQGRLKIRYGGIDSLSKD